MLGRTLTLQVRLVIAGVAAVAFLMVAVLVAVMSFFATPTAAAAICPPANDAPEAPGGASNDQVSNAKAIDATAAKIGLSGQASRIAIIAAMGESSLINIGYGDNATNPDGSTADSLGLFQQQPSQGWGTPEQVMDPDYATQSFLIGKQHDRKGGLVSISGWQLLTPTAAIHKVQGNADPNHYARYYTQADAIIARAGIDVTRAGSDNGSTPDVGDGEDSGAGAPACGASGDLGDVAYPLDRPYNMTSAFGPRGAPTAGASSWHPALDLQNWPGPCGKPVYAMLPGTVTKSDRLWLSIQHPNGFTVSYLHMHKSDRLVDVGMSVEKGQQIGAVGDEAPATGCHLDLRVSDSGMKDSPYKDLEHDPTDTFINTEAFFKQLGIDLCPAAECRRP